MDGDRSGTEARNRTGVRSNGRPARERSILLGLGRSMVAVFAVAVMLPADTVVTKDGKKLEGRILEEKDGHVVIRTYGNGDITVPRADVRSLTRGRSRFDEYDEKIKRSPPRSAEDHYKLGSWCKGKGLVGLSRDHFRKAVELDPTMDKARIAMGMRKVGDRWLTEEEYERWEKRNNPKNAVGFDLVVAVEADLPKDRLDRMSRHFASFAPHFWFMAEGNFFLKTVQVKDKSGSGRVVVKAGDEEKEFIAGGGVSVRGSHMMVGGNCSLYTFLHESGHVFWSLPDEYKNQGGGCPACVMVGGGMEGFGPGKWKFCDESNHTGPSKPDCWAQIQARYPSARHPNKEFQADLWPEPAVSVINSGN